MRNLPSTEDYQSLKKFVINFFDWYMLSDSIRQQVKPFSEIFEGVERTSIQDAYYELKSCVNDIMEISSDWSLKQISEADQRLSEIGAFTLSEARKLYSKKYHQILRRGFIRNENECYMIKGILDGVMEAGTPETRKMGNF